MEKNETLDRLTNNMGICEVDHVNDIICHVDNSTLEKMEDLTEEMDVSEYGDEFAFYDVDYINFNGVNDDYLKQILKSSGIIDPTLTYIIKNKTFSNPINIKSNGHCNIVFIGCTFNGNIQIVNFPGNITFEKCTFKTDSLYKNNAYMRISIDGKLVFNETNYILDIKDLMYGMNIKANQLVLMNSNIFDMALMGTYIYTKKFALVNSNFEFVGNSKINSEEILNRDSFIIGHGSNAKVTIQSICSEVKNIVCPIININGTNIENECNIDPKLNDIRIQRIRLLNRLYEVNRYCSTILEEIQEELKKQIEEEYNQKEKVILEQKIASYLKKQ